MTNLVSASTAKKLVNTSLADADLDVVIERIESEITERIGAPQTDAMETTVTKTLRGEGFYLFMPKEIHAVVSITEDGALLDETEYRVWAGGVIERLPAESCWGDRNVVVYKPVDDRKKRTQVIIDLVRLTLERTALKQENIAGEYSYTAPDDWDAEFRKAMRKLSFRAM
jgi:hypothetical protein